jgi:hypothetical protein
MNDNNIYEIISTIINVILLILVRFQNVKVKKLTSIAPPPMSTVDRCADCIYKNGMEKTIDEITKRITRTGETDIDSETNRKS